DVLACDTVIVDELHERPMDVDLILALLRDRHRGRLVVMSATLEAEKVASYLNGEHLHAEVRQHPVEVSYLGGPLLPDLRGLEGRVHEALDACRDVPGDILVFLPGKGEIANVASALSARRSDVDVIPLHGALSLDEQGRAFRTSNRRKVVLATNVAETSVTVPGVGVVIDSGLVRRTRYHQGRGFLTLMPIAQDSADQRAGRAGRTMAGRCLRLWQRAANLERTTPPEIHRESLLPLVLAAAACDARVTALPFLDAPADYAIEAAQNEARALGALDDREAITTTGRALFGLPLDAPLGRLLVEARQRGTLEDAVDLVAALGVGRPLFSRPPGSDADDPDDLRHAGCDATAAILAVRRGDPGRDGLAAGTLADARRDRKRLRRAMGLSDRPDKGRAVDREALCRTALAADPRSAHVRRERRRKVAWSNGGTEIELGRQSAVTRLESVESLVVFETRAMGDRRMKTSIIATCASPAPHAWLVAEGLGRDRVAKVKWVSGELVASVERVFARKVIAERQFEPKGELAREALAKLIARGKIFPDAKEVTRERLGKRRLAARLMSRGLLSLDGEDAASLADEDHETWLVARLGELGVEEPSDVALLSADDVTAPSLAWDVARQLDEHFPAEVSTQDARYRVEVDVEEAEIILRYAGGNRGRVPRRGALPAFAGFKIKVDTGKGWAVVK
ncbi:MAG: helicase-related protein, partial [Polyangiaceae bacterium]